MAADLTALRGTARPLREGRTLAFELLMQMTLTRGSLLAPLDITVYQSYA